MDEKQKIDIYSPRYEGSRFEEHRFPLDLIEDLLMLRNMTIEMAKVIYLEKNSGRQRVPRNFTNGISIELESIESGSTIPRLVLIMTLSGLFPEANAQYFQDAPERIKKAIEAAHLDQDVHAFVPDNVLQYFNHFGNNLKDDERIIFGNKEHSNVILDKESRKRLVLAASKVKEYNSTFEIRGIITALDKERKTFEIQLITGSKLRGDYTPKHLAVLQDALVGMEKQQKIWMTGEGVFSASDRLSKIASIDDAVLLDALDVPARLEELSNLKPGWLDGEQGEPIDYQALKWLGEAFENNYNSEKFPLPATFPTPDGNIQFEWSINKYEISLAVTLADRLGQFYAYNTETSDEKDTALQLSENKGWQQLNKLMQAIHG